MTLPVTSDIREAMPEISSAVQLKLEAEKARRLASAAFGEEEVRTFVKIAAMLDRVTLIRSVDCRNSNHEPNTVLQTGHPEARTLSWRPLAVALLVVCARM